MYTRVNFSRNVLILFLIFTCCLSCNKSQNLIFIEAESFLSPGGWVIDQQAMDIMGSPYLLAHGLGMPVNDAETKIEVHTGNDYHVWVRTRDWVAPWKASGTPGKFQLLIEDEPLKTI